MGYRVPAFSYPGGKVRLREWLVRRMPLRGRRYVEPFAGRGNVFWLAVHMLDFEEWYLNDPWTCRWFEAIEKVKIADIPYELTEILARFYRKRAIDHREEDDVAVAIEERVMYSGGTKEGITFHWQRSPSLSRFVKNLKMARSILKAVRPRVTAFEWQDCGLEDLGDQDFVYLDPPYETADKRLYHHNTVVHEDLLAYLLEAPHLWMLSGYMSPLYDRCLGKPTLRVLQRMCVQHHQRGENPIFREECVWTNYTIGSDGIVKRKRLKARRIRKKRLKK